MSQRRATGQEWQRRIAEQQASGLSAAAWCRREGINRKRFYLWRRRLWSAAAASEPRQRRGDGARRHWQRLVQEQARSGESVAAFCRTRRLCAPHFFAWKRRLAAPAPEPSAFVVVTVAAEQSPASAPIEVRLANGRALLVSAGFERGHLLALIDTLEVGR